MTHVPGPTSAAPTFSLQPSSSQGIAPVSSPSPQHPVNAREHIAPGTGMRVVLAVIVLILAVLITVGITFGVAIIFWGIGILLYYFRLSKSRAALHASALQIGPNQLPEIHRMATQMSQRLGLGEDPTVLVLDSAQPNAVATKMGQRLYVVLFDEVVYGAEMIKNPKALEWILAHELAHHALGHTSLFRGALSANLPSLSRLDEFSADAVAHSLLRDAAAGQQALAMLMVGPQVAQKINWPELQRQIQQANENEDTIGAERVFRLSHPLFLRRMARIATLG
ncbi:MAG: M48 family metallopeptidase [Phycisphaerales bacterium]